MTLKITPSRQTTQVLAIGRLRLSVEIFVWRQGRLWPLTVCLCTLAIGLWMFQVQPLSMSLAATYNQIAGLELAAKRKQIANNPKSSSSEIKATTHTLAAALPTLTQADADVRALYTLAVANGMTIQHADFTTADDTVVGITRLQMIAPVTTTYPQLRQFVETLLRNSQHATVDQLAFQRDDVGQREVHAKFRVSWWFRTGKMIEPHDTSLSVDGKHS